MENKYNGRSCQRGKKIIRKGTNHQSLRKKKGFYMTLVQEIIAKKNI